MISERNEAFGVRVYRGQERGYDWIGTFKFRDYGGRRGARKAAEQAEAEARFRGSGTQRRALTIEAYVERYLDDYASARRTRPTWLPARAWRRFGASSAT